VRLGEQNRSASWPSGQTELIHGMPVNVLECCADAIGNEKKVKVPLRTTPAGICARKPDAIGGQHTTEDQRVEPRAQ